MRRLKINQCQNCISRNAAPHSANSSSKRFEVSSTGHPSTFHVEPFAAGSLPGTYRTSIRNKICRMNSPYDGVITQFLPANRDLSATVFEDGFWSRRAHRTQDNLFGYRYMYSYNADKICVTLYLVITIGGWQNRPAIQDKRFGCQNVNHRESVRFRPRPKPLTRLRVQGGADDTQKLPGLAKLGAPPLSAWASDTFAF